MATFGSAPGIIVGAGVGAAASIALAPAFELPKQRAWAANPNRIFDVGTLAQLVAIGALGLPAATAEAKRDGYGSDKLNQLVYAAQRVPPLGEGLALWRRGFITDDLYGHIIVKEGFDTRYVPALMAMKLGERNDPVQIANAIHRGIMDDPGLLVHPLDLSPGNVDAYPVSPLDPLAEAASWGLDRERLRVLVGLQGLPMGSHEAAQAYFRGILLRQDYNRAIAEGNTRNEWADPILEQSRDIPTSRDYIESNIRGWSSLEEMFAGAARHGMTREDATLLQLVHGRAPAAHRVFIGKRRGGTRPDPRVNPNPEWPDIDADFLQALRESNIRPEWYGIEWAQRFTYPAAFVLRGMAQAGDLTQAETEEILLYEGWEPGLATKVSTRWAGAAAGTAATDPLVKKAQSQLWTATHRSYVVGDAGVGAVRTNLNLLGADTATQDAILTLWDAEAALTRADLSRADIRKEYRADLIDVATAITRLVELGYSQEEATAYLQLG